MLGNDGKPHAARNALPDGGFVFTYSQQGRETGTLPRHLACDRLWKRRGTLFHIQTHTDIGKRLELMPTLLCSVIH